jgi:hypothetical protein
MIHRASSFFSVEMKPKPNCNPNGRMPNGIFVRYYVVITTAYLSTLCRKTKSRSEAVLKAKTSLGGAKVSWCWTGGGWEGGYT